jgi:hypothetical protein
MCDTLGTSDVSGERLPGGSGGPCGDRFWHSIRGQSPSAKRVLSGGSRPGVWGGGAPSGGYGPGCVLGRLAGQEVHAKRAELVDGRIDPAGRVAFERTGTGR